MNIKTTLLICQHNRCSKLLELIKMCDERIATYKKSVDFHKRATNSYETIDWYYDRWKITIEIKERLINSYSNALARIVRPVIDKMEMVEQ